MSKPYKFGQPLPKKSRIIKKTISKADLKTSTSSLTPTLTFLNQPLSLRSGTITRETQSYASSPQNKPSDFKLIYTSPTPKEQKDIDDLMKKTLKKFKNQKLELEKIKETARTWKESRKKKLEEYNVQTRNENKFKFKREAFRPKTAWGSPEIKDVIYDRKKVCLRHSGCSSTERRAAIGLEFYNLKSPRNSTPRILQGNPIQKPKPVEVKKGLEDFIKKKRKERKKLALLEKEKEEEFEFKRLSQLIKIERIAKKALKKGKKPKTKGKKKVKILTKHKKKIVKEGSFQSSEKHKIQSICYSEDEEVVNIMKVRNLSSSELNAREGRACAIFGNFSNQFSNDGANATEIANKIVGKFVKSEEHSIIVSSSMPIIELKSISNDSGSDISDNKQDLRKKIEEMKFRLVVPRLWDNESDNEKELNFDIGAAKLVSWINSKYITEYFTVIKKFQKSLQYIETPQLSGFKDQIKISNSSETHLDGKKEELEQALNNLAHGKSREASEDMEKIWDKILLASKNTEYLSSPEPIMSLSPFTENKNKPSPLTPTTPDENFALKSHQENPVNSYQTDKSDSKKSSLTSNKISSDLSSSVMNQLKKVQFPSAEFLSFANPGEITHEDLIDSPSLISENSSTSEELENSSPIFITTNSPLLIIIQEPEPRKLLIENSKPKMPLIEKTEPKKPITTYPEPKKPSPILIDDGSSSISISEYTAAIKENSLLATPEEEIEEFSSINFDFNYKRPINNIQETSLNPFSISEETLVLDEDDIIEKTISWLYQWYISDIAETYITEEFRKTHYQLIGNANVVFHEVYVRTGVSAVMSFVEKIWNIVANDIESFIKIMKTSDVHLIKLGVIQNNAYETYEGILENHVLTNAEAPSDMSLSLSLAEVPSEPTRIHNQMVFDCVNHYLRNIQKSYNPDPWKTKASSKTQLPVETIFQQVNLEIRKNCMITAGRIPSVAMIGDNGQLDEDLLQKIRESALVNLMSEDLNASEQVWVDYDFEETQISIEAAEDILKLLMQEVIEIIY
ncbi:hypothetical protein SteCoe_6860 [Stentor coeruleus]|uniref:DUF4378 domain-containing protein n=1 Tax=Stentor coeruleus TaxID=5963 RepID=A0A1R2CNU2_9CILI|nr:hypothetical protein SteCoe_6860 [Stentor coeruleus]